jgi:hypothetical protein
MAAATCCRSASVSTGEVLDDDAELEAGERDDEPVPCVLELHPAMSTAPVSAAIVDATVLRTTGSFPESASLSLSRRGVEDVARCWRGLACSLKGIL